MPQIGSQLLLSTAGRPSPCESVLPFCGASCVFKLWGGSGPVRIQEQKTEHFLLHGVNSAAPRVCCKGRWGPRLCPVCLSVSRVLPGKFAVNLSLAFFLAAHLV